ncbi:MAG: carbohydrate deacetylase [Candidatus Omnitrophota bacterium]
MNGEKSGRALILNADDCNLTRGVTEAILECHQRGIVSSTTCLINMPLKERLLKKIASQKRLGLGLHLNITLGAPVSPWRSVLSLLSADRQFDRSLLNPCRFPKAGEVFREYENQLCLFRKFFRRLPTHLDTHHQLHDHRFYFAILYRLARKYRLPIRRSWGVRIPGLGIRTSDHLFGGLGSKRGWSRGKFGRLLRTLPPGLTEVMCHPGKNDPDLKKASSMTAAREIECRIFRDPKWKRILKQRGIFLTHYGLWYT